MRVHAVVCTTIALCFQLGLAEGAGAAVEVEPGFHVSLLADTLGTSLSERGPGSGGWTTDLYVTKGDTQRITRVDAAGTEIPFADLTTLIVNGSGRGPWWPTFDLVGSYGGDLFVDGDEGVAPDHIFRVTSAGSATVFATLPAGAWDNDTLVFDPYGNFGGALFLTEGSNASLYRISVGGTAMLFATGLSVATRQIAFSPGGGFGTSMFVSDSVGAIYRIEPGHTPGDPAPTFTNPVGTPGGLAISESGPFGLDVLYVQDSSTGEIVKLDTDGNKTGTFLTGLASIATVKLASGGTEMIVHEVPGSVWIVRPISPVPSLGLAPALLLGLLLCLVGSLVAGRTAVRFARRS